MIKISTVRNKYNPDEILTNNESFFNNNITSKEFTQEEIDIIKKIDSRSFFIATSEFILT